MHRNPRSPHCARALFHPSERSSHCCAAFALGGASANVCPASFFRLDTEAACASAAAIAGKAFGGSVTLSGLPGGCYWVTLGSTVYYNTHATGAANVYAQLLCAGAAETYARQHVHAMRVAVPPLIPSGWVASTVALRWR